MQQFQADSLHHSVLHNLCYTFSRELVKVRHTGDWPKVASLVDKVRGTLVNPLGLFLAF